MQFLKVYDDVVKEFGFDIRCGIYSKILEFHTNGASCYMSIESMRKFLNCGKTTIREALAYLTEDTVHVIEKVNGKSKRMELADINGKPVPKEPYIIATHRKRDDGSADTNVYAINERHDLFKRIVSHESGGTESALGGTESVLGVVRNPEEGWYGIRTRGGTESVPKKRNEKENLNRKSGRENAPTASDLTEEQINHIKYGFRYDRSKHKSGYYIAKCKKYGYDTVIGFIHDDGIPENPNELSDIETAKMYSAVTSERAGQVQLMSGEWIDGVKDEHGYIHTPDGRLLDVTGNEIW